MTSEARLITPAPADPPDTAAIARLLEAYFVGPIADEAARAVEAEVAAVLADPRRHAGVIADFHPANGGRGFGLAWREELAFDRASPTPLDVVAWVAWSRGLPARPYCPPPFVGAWRQVEPEPAAWELGAGGEVRCGDPRLRARVRWCVHRQSAHGPVGDALWLDDELGISHKVLLVRAASADELVLQAVGLPKPSYRLVRAGQGAA